ncbi:hypothetical protein EVAR_94377_1 [Eumeta japonica]|uniref:Uncharacterized protein n=1 Tax=Eumeta variegata TaxID=151549 RepID=A0A4C1TPY4_EUMVA|nr:hypothetical protein EVAR_94377_1 [Eumeta japonica]
MDSPQESAGNFFSTCVTCAVGTRTHRLSIETRIANVPINPSEDRASNTFSAYKEPRPPAARSLPRRDENSASSRLFLVSPSMVRLRTALQYIGARDATIHKNWPSK